MTFKIHFQCYNSNWCSLLSIFIWLNLNNKLSFLGALFIQPKIPWNRGNFLKIFPANHFQMRIPQPQIPRGIEISGKYFRKCACTSQGCPRLETFRKMFFHSPWRKFKPCNLVKWKAHGEYRICLVKFQLIRTVNSCWYSSHGFRWSRHNPDTNRLTWH